MNQIIYSNNFKKDFDDYKNNKLKNKKIYKSLFIFSLISLILFISYYLFLYFRLSRKETISRKILTVYNIQQLYATNEPISLPVVVSKTGDIADILGIIQIDKINLKYPILSKTTDEFLGIAPCKFYGSNLNDFGNFCISGHNFDNGTLFSNLYLLELGDIIRIYTLNRRFNIIYNL